MRKRFLSILVACAMIGTVIPANIVFAEETEPVVMEEAVAPEEIITENSGVTSAESDTPVTESDAGDEVSEEMTQPNADPADGEMQTEVVISDGMVEQEGDVPDEVVEQEADILDETTQPAPEVSGEQGVPVAQMNVPADDVEPQDDIIAELEDNAMGSEFDLIDGSGLIEEIEVMEETASLSAYSAEGTEITLDENGTWSDNSATLASSGELTYTFNSQTEGYYQLNIATISGTIDRNEGESIHVDVWSAEEDDEQETDFYEEYSKGNFYLKAQKNIRSVYLHIAVLLCHLCSRLVRALLQKLNYLRRLPVVF